MLDDGVREELGAGERGRGRGGGAVAAGAADGREDVAGDPAAERGGFGLVAADDDLVHAGLVDDGDRAALASGADIRLPDTSLVEASGDVADVADLEDRAEVEQDEPGFAVDGDRPNRGRTVCERDQVSGNVGN